MKQTRKELIKTMNTDQDRERIRTDIEILHDQGQTVEEISQGLGLDAELVAHIIDMTITHDCCLEEAKE